MTFDPPIDRPRRNRRTAALRRLVSETRVSPSDLLWPAFVIEGEGVREAISSMPGCARLSIDQLVADASDAVGLGIPGIALFPALDTGKKDTRATESTNADGLL